MVKLHIGCVVVTRQRPYAFFDGKLEPVLNAGKSVEFFHQLMGPRHIEEFGIEQPSTFGQKQSELNIGGIVVDDPKQIVNQLNTHIHRVYGVQFSNTPEFVFHIKKPFP